MAKILITGKDIGGGGSGALQRECAEVVATVDSSEAIAYSVRTAAFKKVYAVTYSKQNGDTNLTHKIFDSVTGSGRYIALLDTWITGSVLRLRFKNYFGGSATLWVKGSAEVY
jgi:predicted transcriptional regulator